MTQKLPLKKTEPKADKNFRAIGHQLQVESDAREVVDSKVVEHRAVVADRATQSFSGTITKGVGGVQQTLAIGVAAYHCRQLFLICITQTPGTIPSTATYNVLVDGSVVATGTLTYDGSTGVAQVLVTESVDRDSVVVAVVDDDSTTGVIGTVHLVPDEPRIKAEIKRNGG